MFYTHAPFTKKYVNFIGFFKINYYYYDNIKSLSIIFVPVSFLLY